MKRWLVFLFCLLMSCHVFAAGGIAHMYIAKQSIPLMTDKRLRDLIQNNMDAYLVGANYPDTGYVPGTHYGEDSHWEPFLNAFVSWIHAHYTDPLDQNPKLVAFLMGCVTHSVSDRIFHADFVTAEAQHDFHGDYDTAHQNLDTGLDFIINTEKNQWLTRPLTWWVPVDTLVEVYQLMGKPHPASEIRYGNDIYSTGSVAERVVDPITYLYYKYKMPWADAHYETAPTGGMHVLEQASADYVESYWLKILAG
ncbi:MAG: zinc dependent phospholipase C family protein [Gammaproteobacteria bacterium]|nr:zinc dependent phospholipase C family protein [Gammaproteobacteria bacterium]